MGLNFPPLAPPGSCCYATECQVPGTKTVACKEPGCNLLVHHLCFDHYWRATLPEVEPPEGGATDAYCKAHAPMPRPEEQQPLDNIQQEQQGQQEQQAEKEATKRGRGKRSARGKRKATEGRD